MAFPTASLTANDVVLQPGVTYSLGSLLSYSDAGNTGDPITGASLGLFPSQTYSLSGYLVDFGPGGLPRTTGMRSRALWTRRLVHYRRVH
jgi:hypothetical protein